MKYPIQWKELTLHFGQITVKAKMEFCAWLKLYLTTDIIRNLPVGDAQANALRHIAAEPPFWNDGEAHADVVKSIESRDGAIKLHRLLMDDKDNKLISDDELFAMIRAKQRDAKSDYMIAMPLIRGDSDPKALTSDNSGDQKDATSTSAAS